MKGVLFLSKMVYKKGKGLDLRAASPRMKLYRVGARASDLTNVDCNFCR